jgi:hypothetical protein
MCSGVLPFLTNLPTTKYKQECEFLRSQPVGRRESLSNCFVMSSAFGTALLSTIYRNVTYFHNVSRDLTATFLYFRKFSHLTIRHTTCTPTRIKVPVISASLLPSKRTIRTLFVGTDHVSCWVRRVGSAFKACVYTSICGDI